MSDNKFSLFVSKDNQIVEEFYDLSENRAMKISMDKLYENGKLVPSTSITMRHITDGIVFSANNP